MYSMKKKISIIASFFLLLLLLISLSSYMKYSRYKNYVLPKDTSKVLTTVNNRTITQRDVDMAMYKPYTSEMSKLSEKEVLELLIDNELILMKAQELKITVSDIKAIKETERERYLITNGGGQTPSGPYTQQHTEIKNFQYKFNLTEEEYWRCYAVQEYKKEETISKTKKKLGSDTDKILKQLREEADVKYYN